MIDRTELPEYLMQTTIKCRFLRWLGRRHRLAQYIEDCPAGPGSAIDLAERVWGKHWREHPRFYSGLRRVWQWLKYRWLTCRENSSQR